MKKFITNPVLTKRILVAILLTMYLAPTLIKAQNFPAGFSQVKVATVYYPTSMAFAPDGRIFVTEKAGKVKIIKNGAILPTPFVQVSVDELNERGLSCVCLDPDFNNNHFVYVYYTSNSGSIHNRLSRFTANGDVAVAGSEHIILEFEPSVNSIHNSGGMAFGSDGKLFLAVGNDNVNSNSQDLSNYKGKILRINTDGSVPSGNPFTGSESAKRIWAYGLRNPWTLSIQPGTGKLFANEVGEGAWEEVNDATTAGKNFGWPGSEGMTNNPAYTNPVYTYPHGTTGSNDGCAITGGTFFNPSSTNYPAQYTGKYFFIDYCNDWINYLDLSSGVVKHNFASGLPGSENYIKVSNDGNLYYFSISQNSLYKIIYSNNDAPAITTQPANITVPQGQPATFSVTVSGATPLSYQWKKNGANISGANSASYTINNVQSSDSGKYSVVVTNSFGSATSNPATLTVTAFNAKPVATITAPPGSTLYRDGDVINFSGDATDQEDGTLPASAFNWVIEFHHDMHYHPGPTVPQGVKNGSFTTSFGSETAANVYFRLILIVTDSKGLTDSAHVDIHPHTSTLTLKSQPSGLQLLLEGQPHTTPYSVLAIPKMTRSLGVNSPQSLNGTNYIFDHWQQGGAASQNIVITDSDQTFTAVFKQADSTNTCSATGNITRDFWSNITGTTIADVPVNTTPTSTSLLTVFEGPSNIADHYGSRIRGYICPPETGNYIFWIASDNGSELWLSTTSNPVDKVKIASVPSWTKQREWTKYPAQQSAAINLTANTKYYIEAIHREGIEGDHLSVGWQLPGGTKERPIPGSRLSQYIINTPPSVTITAPKNGTVYSNPANITINANAASSGGSITKVEFFQGTTKIGEDLTAPYSFTWTNVTTGNYALKAVANDNAGSKSDSAIVNITVASCPTPVITASGPLTMCSGSVTLSTSTAAGNSYQWKKDGVNIDAATNASYTANAAGEYQVRVIQGSCISWSAPATVKIKNGLSASITPGGSTTICTNGNVMLYANTCSGYTYQWIKDGTNITAATTSTYNATTAGKYQVRVTQASVNAWSAIVTVYTDPCMNKKQDAVQDVSASILPDASNDFQMKVFPNPNNGFFTIVLNMATFQDEKIKMKIVNVLGQEIYNKEYTANSDFLTEVVELDKSLPTGIYTLQVMIGNKVENTSVLLTK
jgi:glucose/arabinose dehydrogenase